MEVGVQVSKEDPQGGDKVIATTAHLTFVALDENKKPTAVPPILPETEEEKKRCENAKLRVKARKELLEKMN
jgi:acyl-CoA hydrolase